MDGRITLQSSRPTLLRAGVRRGLSTQGRELVQGHWWTKWWRDGLLNQCRMWLQSPFQCRTQVLN
jgi:hypothetical protein